MSERTLKLTLGRQLRALRTKRGLTQTQMAAELSVSSRYYEGVERGERNLSLDTIEKIASRLAVPTINLLSEDNR